MANSKKNKKTPTGVPEYNLGGWIKENKQGIVGGVTAAAGAGLMAVPGLQGLGGSLVAQGIGGVASEISDGNSQDQQAPMPYLAQSSKPATFSKGGYLKRMPNGGLLPSGPNAELQKGEPFMTPGGKIRAISKSAPTHAQGGVKMNLPGGTTVLGNKKNPETGNKFQDDGFKEMKKQSKADKILAKNISKRARNSALLNKTNAVNAYKHLYELQEFSKGGKVKKGNMYNNGGETPPVNPMPYSENVPIWAGNAEYSQFHTPEGAGTAATALNNTVGNWKYLQQGMGTSNSNLGPVQSNPGVTTPTTTAARSGQFDYNPNLTNNGMTGRSVNGNPGVTYDRSTTPSTGGATASTTGVNMGDLNAKYNVNQTPYSLSPLNVSGNAPYQNAGDLNRTLGGAQPTLPSGDNIGTVDAFGGNYNKFANNATGGGLSGFLEKNGDSLAALAPSLFNLGQAIFNKPKKEKLPSYYSQGLAELRNRKFNIEPILDANRAAQQTYNTNVTQSGAGSGQVMAGRLAGLGTRMRADEGAWAQKNNIENQYAQQYAQGLFGTGAAQREVDVANLQNIAARDNMISQSVADYSKWNQTQQLMNNLLERDKERVRIQEAVDPFYNSRFGNINLKLN